MLRHVGVVPRVPVFAKRGTSICPSTWACCFPMASYLKTQTRLTRHHRWSTAPMAILSGRHRRHRVFASKASSPPCAPAGCLGWCRRTWAMPPVTSLRQPPCASHGGTLLRVLDGRSGGGVYGGAGPSFWMCACMSRIQRRCLMNRWLVFEVLDLLLLHLLPRGLRTP